MKGIILFFVLSFGLVSLASEEGIYIKEFKFDPKSKEFEISYFNSDQTNISVLRSSSPIYLCVFNQLLHKYYQTFQNMVDKRIEFSREHLKLINQVAYMVPEVEKENIRNSIKNYLKQFNKNGNIIFQTLDQSISHLLKDETLKIKEETVITEERKSTIEREIKEVTDQIESAKKVEKEKGLTLKHLLIRALEGKKEKLSQLLGRLPKQLSKAERNISALENPFCSEEKSKYKLLNEDPSYLLERFTDEITKSFPESPYLKSKSLDTHFF